MAELTCDELCGSSVLFCCMDRIEYMFELLYGNDLMDAKIVQINKE